MELDDLKQAWQGQKLDVSEAPDVQNIIKMLQDKNYGPIASIREKFKRSYFLSIISWIFTSVCFILVVIYSEGSFKIFYFYLYSITLSFAIDSIFQYRIMKLLTDLRNINKPIKSEMEMKIWKISKSMNDLLRVKVISLWSFFILIESGYHYISSNFIKYWGPWFDLDMLYRILGYIVITGVSILIGKYSNQKRYGKHVDYLKELASQLQ